MSDISLLSHEYHTASEFSQLLNDALIQLKKYIFQLPGSEHITQKEVEKSRESISQILSAILAQMGLIKENRESRKQDIVVPGSLISHINQERKGDIAYFLEDLERVSLKLNNFSQKLTPKDLVILDYLASAADEQTSKVFRRLMRK